MKKYLFLFSLGFSVFNSAYGQTQNGVNGSNTGSGGMTFDKINPSEEVTVSIVKGPDGSDRLVYKDGNITAKDISLIVIDGEVAPFGTNYPKDVVSAKLLSKSAASAIYGPCGANGALLIYTKAYKASPGPEGGDKK